MAQDVKTQQQKADEDRQRQQQQRESKAGPEKQRSAGSLAEALDMQRENEEKLASDAEKNTAEGYKRAAQAELDAQQADVDAGYATDATETVPESERPNKLADVQEEERKAREAEKKNK